MEVVVKKYDTVPLRGMTEEILNDKIFNLSEWLSQLLSLKADDKNVSRLEVLLPLVKDYCWSLSIEEIQKAFLKYIKGELPGLEPIDNYLTAILFGKVIKAYKEQRPVKKKKMELPEMTQSQKEDIIYTGIINCFDSYVQNQMVIPGYTYVYDELDERNLLDFDIDEKRDAMKKAKTQLKLLAKEVDNIFKMKSMLSELENKNAPAIINQSKRILLGKYFDELIKDQKHIKDGIRPTTVSK